jgi:hypothetical protein
LRPVFPQRPGELRRAGKNPLEGGIHPASAIPEDDSNGPVLEKWSQLHHPGCVCPGAEVPAAAVREADGRQARPLSDVNPWRRAIEAAVMRADTHAGRLRNLTATSPTHSYPDASVHSPLRLGFQDSTRRVRVWMPRRSGPAGFRSRSAACAAFQPHIPCTPPPG